MLVLLFVLFFFLLVLQLHGPTLRLFSSPTSRVNTYVRAHVLPYIASCSGVLAAGRVSFSLSGCQPGAAPACAMATFAALMTQKKRKPEGVVLGRPQKCHIREAQAVEASIAHGERVVQFMRSRYGDEKAEDMLSDIAAAGRPAGRPVVINVDGPRERKNAMMWGFWRAFIEEEMQVKFDSRKRMRYLRALRFYLQRREEGAVTLCGLRGDRKVRSRRLDGGNRNRVLCPALGLHLLQYFTDHVHQLNCRTDSHLLMRHARELRAYLIKKGTPEIELPKLIGNPGAAWFRRWRLRYGIHPCAGWM